MSLRVEIKQLPSGVPGLDDVLGGGLPEYSFNLIAGSPGAGKTTLAHQMMFASASPECKALFITILGEPPIKMLRYQQQFSFFDDAKFPSCIKFLHLGSSIIEGGLDKVLQSIVKEVQANNPKLVFVDSFRAVVRKARDAGEMDLQEFVQRLSLHLTSLEATTFLIGEYEDREAESNPIFTVADGILWLSQVASRNSITRKLQVVKMRGQAPAAGMHTMTISDAGVRVYPRLGDPERAPIESPDARVRRKTGSTGLDEMLHGGIPSGYSVLLVGPSGSGKTTLATQFIRQGIANGEPGVIAAFEKRPEEYRVRGDFARHVERGLLSVLSLRPLDLSIEETLDEIAVAVRAIGAKRVVIDSLSGFELALAPSSRDDFRECLHRMVNALIGLGVTVVMTAEAPDSATELRLSPHAISFLTDGLIVQRYVELRGQLRKVVVVVKMCGFDHSKDFKLYDIGPEGIVIGDALSEYDAILAGAPRLAKDKPE